MKITRDGDILIKRLSECQVFVLSQTDLLTHKQTQSASVFPLLSSQHKQTTKTSLPTTTTNTTSGEVHCNCCSPSSNSSSSSSSSLNNNTNNNNKPANTRKANLHTKKQQHIFSISSTPQIDNLRRKSLISNSNNNSSSSSSGYIESNSAVALIKAQININKKVIKQQQQLPINGKLAKHLNHHDRQTKTANNNHKSVSSSDLTTMMSTSSSSSSSLSFAARQFAWPSTGNLLHQQQQQQHNLATNSRSMSSSSSPSSAQRLNISSKHNSSNSKLVDVLHESRGFSATNLQYNLPFKLFDMTKFKAQLANESQFAVPNLNKLLSECISIVSFASSDCNILNLPSWLMIINIVAMDLLHSTLGSLSPQLQQRLTNRCSRDQDRRLIQRQLFQHRIFNNDNFYNKQQRQVARKQLLLGRNENDDFPAQSKAINNLVMQQQPQEIAKHLNISSNYKLLQHQQQVADNKQTSGKELNANLILVSPTGFSPKFNRKAKPFNQLDSNKLSSGKLMQATSALPFACVKYVDENGSCQLIKGNNETLLSSIDSQTIPPHAQLAPPEMTKSILKLLSKVNAKSSQQQQQQPNNSNNSNKQQLENDTNQIPPRQLPSSVSPFKSIGDKLDFFAQKQNKNNHRFKSTSKQQHQQQLY